MCIYGKKDSRCNQSTEPVKTTGTAETKGKIILMKICMHVTNNQIESIEAEN